MTPYISNIILRSWDNRVYANVGWHLSIAIESKPTKHKQKCYASTFCIEDEQEIKQGDTRLVIEWMDGGYKRTSTYHPVCFLNVIVQILSQGNIKTKKSMMDILTRLL